MGSPAVGEFMTRKVVTLLAMAPSFTGGLHRRLHAYMPIVSGRAAHIGSVGDGRIDNTCRLLAQSPT
jgi:hypothetical protein